MDVWVVTEASSYTGTAVRIHRLHLDDCPDLDDGAQRLFLLDPDERDAALADPIPLGAAWCGKCRERVETPTTGTLPAARLVPGPLEAAVIGAYRYCGALAAAYPRVLFGKETGVGVTS